MTLVEKIRSNMAEHGLFWAARKYREQMRRAHRIDNFDVFYYAVFGKWPTR